MSRRLRILTNMAFWQSEAWCAATDSLYDVAVRRDPEFRPWWREALDLWRRAGAYDVVVTMGVRESMAYGLLCLLTGRPSRQVMCEVFIDAPRRGPRWALKNALYRRVAARALGLLANSSGEVPTIARRYALPLERVRYVPLNTTIALPALAAADDGFVLSAGRTLRDYASLLQAAPRWRTPVIIICGRDDLRDTALPPGVTVLREVAREVYLDHLRRCRLVALPLLPTERATGQVVMLEAMALGKPVVTSRTPGTVDLLQHEVTGLLVEPGDAGSLAQAVQRLLDDPALARRLSNAALAFVRAEGSTDLHARRKLEAITSLWQAGHPG